MCLSARHCIRSAREYLPIEFLTMTPYGRLSESRTNQMRLFPTKNSPSPDAESSMGF